jgi:NADPH:quinone reductase-like Zn-dependent oxidoreductase
VLIHKQDVAELEQLASLCASSQLSPVVDGIYPLEQIQDAFARFASGQFVGKIVISIGSGQPS